MRNYFTIIVLGLALNCFGQQSPQYSQYIYNQYMINPAATGANDYLGINLGGRMQWAGFPNAPKTTYLYFSSPADKLRGGWMKRTFGKVKRNNRSVKHPTARRTSLIHAFGGHLLADQYGAFRTLKFAGSYAVHIPISMDYKLSFGTHVGLSSRAFLPEEAQVLSAITGTGNDAIYNTMTSGGAQYTMDVESGLYFYSKELFLGFSANQLTRDLVKFGNRNLYTAPRTHFFGIAGYRFMMNNRWQITPAVLAKYVSAAPLSIEGSVLFNYDSRFWFGASYRHQDAVVALLGMNISDTFRIGYSFDLSISKMIKYNSGGHELVLSLMLGKSRGSSASFI